MINKIKEISKSIFEEIVEIRRHLHMYPELSFCEYNTSSYIKSILNKWNIPFTEGIAVNGIVVVLHGINKEKKTIALRADFDALPIKEENDIEYCSKNSGVMHACGHDAHTASLLGVIRILDSLKNDWEGSIKFIFQPAEEMLPGGAKQMIEEGVLDNPKVSKVIGQHVFPDLEVGKVGFLKGKYMASTDEIYIDVIGKGGHAALTDTYNNPIISASKLINELEIVFKQYRDIPCVLAFGFIEGRGSTNVIPNNVSIKGTLRVLDEKFRKQAKKIIKQTVDSIAISNNLDINLNICQGYPCLVNDESLTENLIIFAKQYLGSDNVIELSLRMTGEDFAYFSQTVPSCFYRLGTSNVKNGITAGLHTSTFNIDEKSLEIGMGLMAYLAINN